MYHKYYYIVLTLIGVFLFSCNEPTSEKQETRTDDESLILSEEPVRQNVIRLEKETISNITTETQVRTYENTTVYAGMTIGDVLDVHLSELIPVDQGEVADQPEVKLPARKGIIYKYGITKWQLSLILDNDIFDNRDYYYTNGFKIELVAPFANQSPLRKILPGIRNAEIDQNGLSIAQNIYTPTNPDTGVILASDHPFAAYLTVGEFRDNYSLRKKLHFRSEIRIGVIGPSSFGQQVQTSVHEIEPVGWQNQVSNDLILDYYFKVEKGIISNSHFEFNALGQANVGTLYNKVGGGLNLRIGNFMPVFKGPFSLFENKNPGGRLQFWVFVKSQIDLIGYDATLQGGLFTNENVYVIDQSDLNRFIFQSSLGFAFYYNNIGIEYEHFYETPRFKNAYHFGWGSLKAVIAF